MNDGPVAVIGLGLIGGSLAAALRRSGLRVYGADTSRAHAAYALQTGLVDEIEESCSVAAKAAVVVIAAPVAATVELLPKVAASNPTAVIMDTASVKRPILNAMGRIDNPARAVGGHPLAGKERSGPTAADPDLFRGRPFVLVPGDLTDARTCTTAHRLIDRVGGRPHTVDAPTHDAIVARTSHLPQLLSSLLSALVRVDDVSMMGSGFRDTARLARSDPALWRDIFLANEDCVLDALDEFGSLLEHMRRALAQGDGDGIESLLREGREKAYARGEGDVL